MEASTTPTICRLPDLNRHQLSTIAREAADPYDVARIKVDGKYRYPMIYGFDEALLKRGKEASHDVSRQLHRDVEDKLFCIRGVQAQDKTPVTLNWERVEADFDPWPTHIPDPIVVSMGPGDGVQAAWGARLLGLPRRQVITVVGEDRDIEHTSLMNASPVQREIAILLGVDPIGHQEARQVIVATREQLNDFLQGVRTNVNDRPRSEEERRRAIELYFGGFESTELHKLFRRAYMDFLKG